MRPRTNTFNAVFRLRSVLSMAIHEFFQNQGFVYVHTPILTGITCEGDNMFHCVTNDKDPNEYFGRTTLLSGSGQIHVESFAMAFRDVYTFGPTFRSEKSNTKTHASEFWMIEPEIAFADLKDDMNLIEDMVKYVVSYVLENAKEEIDFFDKFVAPGKKAQLEALVKSTVAECTHHEAIEILKAAGNIFENAPEFGKDLATEHEKYLTDVHFKAPVFVTNWPKDIKAFYMRLNDDNETVAAVDLLVPGAGELVGGSQREERLELLVQRMNDLGMKIEPLDWYVDLRKYGGVKHAGFGLGFERLIMYVTGMDNIRDVIPYARTPKNCEF